MTGAVTTSDADVRRLDEVRLRVAAGASPGDPADLPGRTGTVVRVATEAGSPLLDALDAAGEAEDDRRRSARAVAVASAQGRAVTTGMALAPVVLVPLLARGYGVDLVAYHRSPLGTVTGVLGVVLVATGVAVSRRTVARVGRRPRPSVRRPVGAAVGALAAAVLAGVAIHVAAAVVVLGIAVRRARRPRVLPVDPGVAEAIELAAVAVGGGLGPAPALRVAATEVPELAVDLRRLAFDLEVGSCSGRIGVGDALGPLPPGVDRLAEVLVTADHLGAPVAPTLRRLAADLRADELARVLAAAERLPVQLAVPTTVLVLPGVLLLVGAPVLVSGLSAVTG